MSQSCIPLTVSSVARQPRAKAKTRAKTLTRQSSAVVVGPREKPRHLKRQELYRYWLEANEMLMLHVIAGQLWVTMENDATDHVLSKGSRTSFQGPGLLVMEALEEAAVMVIESKPRC